MKLLINKTHAWVAAIGMLAFANVAGAHDLLNQTLGNPQTATDVYTVTCFDDGNGNAQRLEAQIGDDTAGTRITSLVVLKTLSQVTSTTDATGGDATLSPLIKVNGGNGVYSLIVHKDKYGSRQYDLSYHCKTSTGAHTGTTEAITGRTQNQ
jgi:hypothetical protein